MADVSVVIGNYNHAGHLPRALDAVLGQSVRPREVIVIDDASTDDSLSVIDGYARREPLIRVVRNPVNQGVNRTYTAGARLASGSLLLLAGADDYLLPGFLERAVEQLTAHPQAGLCVAYDSYQHGDDGPVIPNPSGWGPAEYYPPDEVAAKLRHCIPGHAVVCRREPFLAAGGFHPDLAWYADWFAFLSLAFRYGACHLPDTLAVRVLRPTAYSAAARPGAQNTAVLAAFLDRVLSPENADVAPLFRRNGAATFFGTDLIRAAVARPDRWDARVLGFLNGFRAEQYEELLADPDPAVRELAGFFLGPFWREAADRRAQAAYQIARLTEELEQARRQIPPPGVGRKLRWLAGKAAGRVRRAAG